MSLKVQAVRATTIMLALLILAGGGWTLGQIFGIDPYGGGTLNIVYRLTKQENDPNPGTLTLNIAPEGSKYKVTESFEMLAPADQLQILVFSHGFAHVPKGFLDMTPIAALDTKPVEPNKEIFLPDGAKLVTQEEVTIGGVKAVKGVYTHPKFEDQRAIIAISDLESRKILPYPPLLRVEKQEQGNWNLVAQTELLSLSQSNP